MKQNRQACNDLQLKSLEIIAKLIDANSESYFKADSILNLIYQAHVNFVNTVPHLGFWANISGCIDCLLGMVGGGGGGIMLFWRLCSKLITMEDDETGCWSRLVARPHDRSGLNYINDLKVF